jgi:Uncharacterized conserved protein
MHQAQPVTHSLYEDVLALVVGTLFVSFGMLIYAKATLAVGGMVGIALLLQYATGLNFWAGFLLVNLPFLGLAVVRLGWRFALRTVVAVALVSLFSRLTVSWVGFSHLDPAYAAVIGGALCGMGLLILFRHHTGLGGINILAIWLQEAFGIRAGWFQLAVDLAILAVAFLVLPLSHVALSVLGTVVINLVLAINHRPGRYLGVS